jgi:hypothetical protein
MEMKSGMISLWCKVNAMPHAYTENLLVEPPAIGLFAELGWTTFSEFEELRRGAAIANDGT